MSYSKVNRVKRKNNIVTYIKGWKKNYIPVAGTERRRRSDVILSDRKMCKKVQVWYSHPHMESTDGKIISHSFPFHSFVIF